MGRIEATLERIEHFTHLTNEPIAIIFVLCPPPDISFQTAKQLVNDSPLSDNPLPTRVGILAYTKLQVELMDHAFPNISVLPLAKLSCLPDLIKNHIAALTMPPPVKPQQSDIYPLLSTCALNNQQSAFILSDTFCSLKEIAEASLAEMDTAQDSSSPTAIAAFADGVLSQMAGDWAGDVTMSSDHASGNVFKLKMLQSLVGEQEKENLMEFWRQECSLDG